MTTHKITFEDIKKFEERMYQVKDADINLMEVSLNNLVDLARVVATLAIRVEKLEKGENK